MGYMGRNSAGTAYVPPSVVNAGRRDRIYFREISSPDVRWIYEAMDEVLDPMEYEGSLLFDEYPDAGEISRLTDQVLRRARKRKSGQESDFRGKAENSGAGAGGADVETETADAGAEIAETWAGTAGVECDDPMQARELAKALLCEEMCRRRFRHLMRRAEMSGQSG